jgi:hypothetical protein
MHPGRGVFQNGKWFFPPEGMQGAPASSSNQNLSPW